MEAQFSANPGQSLQYKSLPNGAPIKGIKIDNPSGGWLYVVSEQRYIEPYTIGVTIDLSYDQTSVTVNYLTAGPAGQVSTQQGDAWTLTLQDSEVGDNVGGKTSFITKFDAKSSITVQKLDVSPGNFVVGIIQSGISAQRIRLYIANATIMNSQGVVGSTAIFAMGAAHIHFYDSQNNYYGRLFLNSEKQSDFIYYGDQGIDLPSGIAIRYAIDTTVCFHTSSYEFTLMYQYV